MNGRTVRFTILMLGTLLAACTGAHLHHSDTGEHAGGEVGAGMEGHHAHGEACAECEAPPHHLPSLSPGDVQRRYSIRVVTDPPTPAAGQPTRCSVYIRGADGKPVDTLEVHHERLAHFLFVGETLADFQHLHPEDQGLLTDEARAQGRFDLDLTFAHGGRYLLAVDFADGGQGVHWEQHIAVEGPPPPKTDWNLSRSRRQGDMELQLSTSGDPVEDRRRQECNIRLTEGGRDVLDLEPYLGALAHLAIFDDGANSVAHVHGGGEEFAHSHAHRAVPGYRGPKVYFAHTFLRPGRYRIYAQFGRGGQVHTVPFDLEVVPRNLGGA